MTLIAIAILGALAPAQSQSAPAPLGAAGLQQQESVQKVLRCIQRVADIPRPRCATFALALGEVLRKHNVSPPVPVTAPTASAPAGDELSDTERLRFRSAVRDLVAACDAARASDPNLARPLHRLRVDLLIAVATECPESAGRLQAGETLAAWVLPDGECRRPLDDLIPPGVALPAIEAAMNYALAKGADGTERWAGTVVDWSAIRLVPQWATCSAMASPPVTPESLGKAVEKVVERVASFQTRDGPDAYVDLVAKVKKAAAAYQAEANETTDELTATLGAMRLCADFFAAVQKEDKAAAGKLLTEKTAHRWLTAPSLRSAVSNTPEAAAVTLVAISPVCKAGAAVYRLEAELRITDAKGLTSGRRIILTLTRAGGNLLIGD